jgi:hypothetical protein
MIKHLWRWSVKKDEWELLTTANDHNTMTVMRGYKRRDRKGVKFRWTDGAAPRKFRTRVKKEA